MNRKKTVCLLGGTGFVGTHLASELSQKGYCVRVVSRHPERFRHLSVLPGVSVEGGDIMDSEQLKGFLKGSTVVINLVGILNQSRRNAFEKINAGFPAMVAEACVTLGIYRILHFSALGADASGGASQYLRSKGEGEQRLMAHSKELDVTVFRPNVVFGEGDHFFNKFVQLMKLLPFVPLVGANTRFAPVFIGDICQAVVQSITNKRCFNQTYELCGPRSYRLKDLVAFSARIVGIKKKVIEIDTKVAMINAFFLEKLPGKLLTRDNLRSLSKDCLCHQPFPEIFGIKPSSIEAIVPHYLDAEYKKTYFDHLRVHAGR